MNPVQFKLRSKDRRNITGMTVFNPEKVDTKKQPMFFGKPLGVQGTIHTNIQSSTN